MLYMIFFFFVISLLQVLPGLIDLLAMEPGLEQQLQAESMTRERVNPLLSLILSLAATSAGAYYQVLPGMRVG
jgi:hypothetical protein